MFTIYKYQINPLQPGLHKVKVSSNRKLLKVDFDLEGALAAWFLVEKAAPLSECSFAVYFTGVECSEDVKNYVATCKSRDLVYHVFYHQ